MPAKRFWEPAKSTVERVPNDLVVSLEQPGIMSTPHWHAQVEINYVFRGTLDYRLQGRSMTLVEGDLCVFWGGLPHQVTDTSDDPFYVAVHLPLMHFFRLHLPENVQNRLMHGAALVTRSADGSDSAQFRRWADYMHSPEVARRAHAIEEMLLRIERVRFEPYQMIDVPDVPAGQPEVLDSQSFQNIGRICGYIAENFRHDIDSVAIASSADIHPKYAMSVFKKSTGMTLNEYVNLLRLSYAQARLMSEETNVLHIAMDSGFGSLSAFNAAFRRICGRSPSDFRRHSRLRPVHMMGLN